MKLTALHFGSIASDESAYAALSETVELAPTLERSGYHRLWIGEHHMPRFAWTTPHVLLAVLAGVTKRLRVGSACVLLKYHRPYEVASAYRLLSGLYPGRIDLGVGAGVVGPEHARALLGDAPLPGAEGYADRVSELRDYVAGDGVDGDVPTSPVGVDPPALWVMGSSARSASLAGRCGASYCYSLFSPSSSRDPGVLDAYRDTFDGDSPGFAIAVAGICTEDASEAQRLRARAEERSAGFVQPTVVGDPSDTAEALAELRETFGTDEVVFHNAAPGRRRRAAAFGMLAEAAGLPSLRRDDPQPTASSTPSSGDA